MDLFQLTTEQRNPNTMHLSKMSTSELLQIMNEEDQKIAIAVQKTLPQIEQVIEHTTQAIRNGGRLIYVGSGTSGRLGMLDASECPPTFMTSPELVQTVMAGGNEAFFRAIERAEDDEAQGELDLKARNITTQDVVIGITASGRTPYPIGAVKYANTVGALTVGLTCNAHSEINNYTAIALEAVVGPEVLTGSTRLKSGTAHKMILNMITTATMVKLGKVYENLMIDVHASNDKLVQRAINIVTELTGAPKNQAKEVLEAVNYEVKLAVIKIKTDLPTEIIREAFLKHHGHVDNTITALMKQ